MILINLKKARTNKEENIFKNTWYDWYDCLISYTPEPKKKIVGKI